MGRGTVTKRRPKGRGVSAPSRLAFVERLLACDSLVEASELGVEWLARHVGVRQVAVALADVGRSARPRLVVIASHGVDAAQVASVPLDLEDPEDPIAAALASHRPTTLPASVLDAMRLTFEPRRCTAHPLTLPSDSGKGPLGLVIMSGAVRDPESKWLFGVLGRKLIELRARPVLERRARRTKQRADVDERTRSYEGLKASSDRLEQNVRDATATLVRQNELLQRQALELEAASRAKSQFLANMSHELRTPLNAILGYTSMLLEGVSGELPAPVIRQLSRVDSNGKHLLSLINDILDIARMEAGSVPLDLTRFSVGDVVREVLAEVDPLVVRARLSVKIVTGPMPTVQSDRPKVKRVLTNLLSNALKFTPSGVVAVSAPVPTTKGEVWISVADTGLGMSEDDQATVFRQVDNSPTHHSGGAGLGLSICRGLAAHLGGDIRLSSKIGEGSTFTLVLPKRGGRGR